MSDYRVSPSPKLSFWNLIGTRIRHGGLAMTLVNGVLQQNASGEDIKMSPSKVYGGKTSYRKASPYI